MENWQRLLLIRLVTLAALAFSVALLAEYWQPGALACGFDFFDCGEVLTSRFGKVLGVPLPVFGALGFASIFACSLSARPWSNRLLRWLALIAGGIGAVLIYIQFFVLSRLCPYCLVVDSSALVIAILAFGRRSDSMSVLSRRACLLWLASALVALGLGAAIGTARYWWPSDDDSTTPPEVSAHWAPGKITIVEVVDFQCPHCRDFHHVLKRFLDEQGQGIRLVRIVSPMEKKHPQARNAARVYLCADAQNKGDEMAERLFAADDLTLPACNRIAISLGLNMEQVHACVTSEQIDQKIDATVAWTDKACPKGLPCLWVQDQRLTAPTFDQLVVAVARAVQRLRAEDAERKRAGSGSGH